MTWHIDDITWWYYMMVLCDDEMSWGHDDGYVVLRAPMDGPVIEATYGEIMIHSTEAVWKMLVWEEWWGVVMIQHPWSKNPVQHTGVGTIFDTFWFSWYEKLCIMFFKSICIIKGILVVSDLILAWRCSEKVFNHPWVLKKDNP